MTVQRVAMQAQGVDVNGLTTTLRTDAAGRLKISHAQPPATVGAIAAVNSAVAVPMDSLSDVVFFLYGTYGANANLIFEQSPDSTDGVNGTWFPIIAKNQGSLASAATSTGVLTANSSVSFAVSAPAASYVRVRATVAPASGSISVSASGSTAARPTDVTAVPVGTYTVTGTTNANMRPTAATGRLSNTNLAASATYTQTTVDQGTDVTAYATRLRPLVRHLAGLTPGHLVLQESIDGTTWIESRRTPVPSDGLYHGFDWPIHQRYYRLLFVNGATAQTGFDLLTNVTRGDGSSVDVATVLSIPLSTTALAAAAVFNGPTLDLGGNHDWTVVRGFVRADQGGAFQIQQSDDGTTWYGPGEASAAASNAGAFISAIEARVQMRYVKAVYTNNAVAQGAFRVGLTLVTA